jgi:hypothetical protein
VVYDPGIGNQSSSIWAESNPQSNDVSLEGLDDGLPNFGLGYYPVFPYTQSKPDDRPTSADTI